MDYTQNLHLPQWEETDRIMMDDFNDAFAKIDTQMKDTADAVLNFKSCKIVVGMYNGNDVDGRKIELGATPKAVFVLANGVSLQTNSNYYGGLSVQGNNSGGIWITDGGFTTVQYSNYRCNASGFRYHYIAVL